MKKDKKRVDVHVRIPRVVWDALARSAKESVRPINSELVVRLAGALGVKP